MPTANLMGVSFVSLLVKKEVWHHLKSKAVRLGLSVLELQVLWVAVVAENIVMIDLAILTSYSEEQLKPIVQSLKDDGLIEEWGMKKFNKKFLKATNKGKTLLAKSCFTTGIKHPTLSIEEEITQDFIEAAFALLNSLRGYDVCEILSLANDSFNFFPFSCLCKDCRSNKED